MRARRSAKVVVVGSPKQALPELCHHMGGMERVPAAWGGTNATPLEAYPANVRMLAFGRALNAGRQPLAQLQHVSDAARAFLQQGPAAAAGSKAAS